MKRIIALLMLLTISFSLFACGEGPLATVEPQVSQMRAICELATMECYYHNVAKYSQDGGSGIFGIDKKDKLFWMEYSGKLIIGVDASLITMTIDDTVVTITMPPAFVKNCTVDSESLSEDSFIVAKDSAKIKAADQTKAVKEAQEIMKASATNDTVLLANAQQRAQMLIEDYVQNIGKAFNINYTVKWIFVNENGTPVNQAVPTGAENEASENPTTISE